MSLIFKGKRLNRAVLRQFQNCYFPRIDTFWHTCAVVHVDKVFHFVKLQSDCQPF